VASTRPEGPREYRNFYVPSTGMRRPPRGDRFSLTRQVFPYLLVPSAYLISPGLSSLMQYVPDFAKATVVPNYLIPHRIAS
jgi:hypothetical protein